MSVALIFLAAVLAAPCANKEWFPVIIEGPAYPVVGTQAQVAGTVKLRVILDEHGKVATAEVISGAPLLARAAQENVKTWGFTSCGKTDQCKNSDAIEFTYVFKLEGHPNALPRSRFRYEHPYTVTVVAQPQHWTPSRSAR